MNSDGIPRREFLSPRAASFFESLSGPEQDYLVGIIRCMCEDPTVDGVTIFDLTVPPAVWRVYVDERYTLYTRVQSDQLKIDAIRPTAGTIVEMLRYPFNDAADEWVVCNHFEGGRLGVGLDNIDVPACEARGVEVIPATGANALAVAEYVIATAMVLLRGAYASTGEVARYLIEQLKVRELAVTPGVDPRGQIGRAFASEGWCVNPAPSAGGASERVFLFFNSPPSLEALYSWAGAPGRGGEGGSEGRGAGGSGDGSGGGGRRRIVQWCVDHPLTIPAWLLDAAETVRPPAQERRPHQVDGLA